LGIQETWNISGASKHFPLVTGGAINKPSFQFSQTHGIN